ACGASLALAFVSCDEEGQLVLAVLELVVQQRRRGGALLEADADSLGFCSPGGEVLRGESDVAAVQRSAADEVGMVAVGALAEGLGGVEDAGDVVAGIDGRVMFLDDPEEPAAVG